MPHELDEDKLKVIQSVSKEWPVKLNLEESIDIRFDWHYEKVWYYFKIFYFK